MNQPDDIYTQRLAAQGKSTTGFQRMTSRRRGPHANLVIKTSNPEEIVKFPAMKGSRWSTRAIQKEFQVLSQLSQNPSLSPHIPTPLKIERPHQDLATHYSICDGVPYNLFLARHIQESVWDHQFSWVVEFLVKLGKSGDRHYPLTAPHTQSLILDRPLGIIQSAYPEDFPAIRDYARDIVDDNLPYHLVPTHGDFNPWNMLVKPGQSLDDLHPWVLDWEDYSHYGLPLYDGFYFIMVCIWLLAFGETKSNNLSVLSVEELVQRNHMITRLAKEFCLNYGQNMQLNKPMIDRLFVCFLLRAAAEDIRPKRNNPASASRWIGILKFGLKENIFLSSVKLMFLHAMKSKAEMTQDTALFEDIESEISRILGG